MTAADTSRAPAAEAYGALMAHVRRTAALAQVRGLCEWDQETMMPPAGADGRVEQVGALSAVLHAHRTDPRVGEWLSKVDDRELDERGRANMRRVRRDFERASRIPARLAEEIARTTSKAQGVWAKARAADDFAAFAPILERVVALRREEAAVLTPSREAAGGADPYDALLDDYEPGMHTADLAAMLDGLRPALVSLRERIAERENGPALSGRYDTRVQMEVAGEICDAFGYSRERGRLDLSTHPFSMGLGADDVRITTRTDEADPFNCLYSTAHEIGHALYEQGLPGRGEPERALEPSAGYVSMGVHESQSRLWENQIGRSRAFCEWLHPRMRFEGYDLSDADALYRCVNRVETGFIRTEADEVHYNLHVMLRFDLERRLVAGTLEVADLEAAWNERFRRDFGLDVPRPSLGVLQDVHWSVGLFGYFPTYTLGNVFAAELFAAMRADLGDIDAMCRAGELSPVLDWLRERIHRRGAHLPPMALMEEAIGHAPTPAPLVEYLEAKFGALYDL